MKTSKLLTTIAFAFMMLVSFNVDAQKFRGLDKSPMDAASFGSGNDQLIKVYYGRPQLNGRDAKKLTQKDKVWTVVISSDVNNWGASGYSEENTVAKITVPVTEGKESLEAFSIAFEKSDDGVHMHMGWGTIRVAVPFAK